MFNISIHNGPAGRTPTLCVSINNQPAGCLISQSIMDRPVGIPKSSFSLQTNWPDAHISVHKGLASGNVSIFNQPARGLIFQSIMDRPVGIPKSLFSSPTSRPDVHISVHEGPAGENATVCISISSQPAR